MRRPPGGARSIDRLRRGELSVMAAGLFAIVGVLALRVRGTGLPLHVDRLGASVVGSARSPRRLPLDPRGVVPVDLLQPFINWGTIAIGTAIVVGVAIVAWRRRDRWAAAVSIAAPVLGVAIVDLLAKPLVGRRHGLALAFPSGHATIAAAAATVVLVLLNRWYGWRRAVRWIPAMALLPLLVGAGLVRLGWHYPTDVVGGVAFGAATAVALAAAIPGPKRLPETTNESPQAPPGVSEPR